jgi:hypothetical protein
MKLIVMVVASGFALAAANSRSEIASLEQTNSYLVHCLSFETASILPSPGDKPLPSSIYELTNSVYMPAFAKVRPTMLASNGLKTVDGYVTNLEIPLNATIQEVVDVLEMNGAEIKESFEEGERETQASILRRSLAGAYDGRAQSHKEDAIKVFDQKVHFPCFRYESRTYCLPPTSFPGLLGTHGYQVFHEDSVPYFTQFALTCEKLPPKLRHFGMMRTCTL